MDGEDRGSILIENERDALHILPLEILPLRTPGLKRARMIKNARLLSVIEIFKSHQSGSGQIGVSDLPTEFDWIEGGGHPDMKILTKLAELPSYDVFSLRVALRKLDIAVNEHEHLRLSDEMNRELTGYMAEFTRPLIAEIYGKDETVDVRSFEDVVALFRDPDVKRALERLKAMADKLGIRPEEVPDFIEDYGDIFMSLSYYRRCLDSLQPIVGDFLQSLADLRANYTLKNDATLQKTIDMLETRVTELTLQIAGRFESFEQGTKNMWTDISAKKFRDLQKMIVRYHVTLGGVLCSLAVKLDAWYRLFPNAGVGGPQKRAEFIMIEMRQGMDKIKDIDVGTPADFR